MYHYKDVGSTDDNGVYRCRAINGATAGPGEVDHSFTLRVQCRPNTCIMRLKLVLKQFLVVIHTICMFSLVIDINSISRLEYCAGILFIINYT